MLFTSTYVLYSMPKVKTKKKTQIQTETNPENNKTPL